MRPREAHSSPGGGDGEEGNPRGSDCVLELRQTEAEVGGGHRVSGPQGWGVSAEVAGGSEGCSLSRERASMLGGVGW